VVLALLLLLLLLGICCCAATSKGTSSPDSVMSHALQAAMPEENAVNSSREQQHSC
jgi:hypothetical protein